MPDPSASAREAGDEERPSRQRIPAPPTSKLLLLSFAAALLLGVEAAFAICLCGDSICGGSSCVPPETSASCPDDCEPPPPPTDLTVRVTVLPFGDPGRFDLQVDGRTLAANLPDGGSTGPHRLTGGTHTLGVTAGAGTDLVNYRTSICGACSAGGAIQPGGPQSCSITNLRLPSPPPAPGCASVCVTEFLRCGTSGEPADFCSDVFSRCRNRCQVSSAPRLSIVRYNRPGTASTTLTETDADRILASMSNVLRTADGTDDIDCNVAFCRDGGIGEYAVGDGIIDTSAELDEVFAVPGDVKFARGIDFCNGFDPLVIGCARGGSFVVERAFANDGALWAHEYGHTRGLEHRDDPNAVMKEGLSPNTRRVNSRECIAYHLGASLAGPDVSTQGPPTATGTGGAAQPPPDIMDFVRQTFVHGTPYDDLTRYDARVIPTLLEMLRDPREVQAWRNIVVALGILGDDRVVAPLIAFIEQGSGELDPAQYKAKRNAFFGLGYLIARGSHDRALAHLKDGVNPASWDARGLRWMPPDVQSAQERNEELSRMAIIGLGVSGHSSAEETLRSMLAVAPSVAGREFQEQMSSLVAEALKANRTISQEGLAKYYRRSTP